MTNKNPFEVRLDIIKMAQEMLDKKVHLEQMKYEQELAAMKAESAKPDVIRKYITENSPKIYSAEDVTSTASTLYKFVGIVPPKTP
jgi:hypothetical protein